MSLLNKKALSDTFSIAHTVLDNPDARANQLNDYENDKFEEAIVGQIAFIIALLENAGFKFQEKNAGSRIEIFEKDFEVVLEKVITDIQEDTQKNLNQILEENKEILISKLNKLITNLKSLYKGMTEIGQIESKLVTMKTQRILLEEMAK